MVISRHAKERIEERLKIKGNKQQKAIAQKAQAKGASKYNAEIPKPLIGYINRKSAAYLNKAKNVRIYNECIWLFSKNGTLITVLTLDNEPGLKRMCKEIKKHSKY